MSEDTPPSPNRAALIAALLGEELWPSVTRLDPNLKDHMHALGVIITYYNALEFGLFLFLYYYLNDTTTTAPQTIFARLNNQQRIDVISRYVEVMERDDQVQDRLRYFLNSYKICTDNRNFLAHSRLHGGGALEAIPMRTPKQIVLAKAPRGAPDRQNYTHMNVADLRKVADDIKVCTHKSGMSAQPPIAA